MISCSSPCRAMTTMPSPAASVPLTAATGKLGSRFISRKPSMAWPLSTYVQIVQLGFSALKIIINPE